MLIVPMRNRNYTISPNKLPPCRLVQEFPHKFIHWREDGMNSATAKQLRTCLLGEAK